MMVVLLATVDSIESRQAMEWVQALPLPDGDDPQRRLATGRNRDRRR